MSDQSYQINNSSFSFYKYFVYKWSPIDTIAQYMTKVSCENIFFQIKAGSELQKSYDPVAQDLYNNLHHNKLIKKWWLNVF